MFDYNLDYDEGIILESEDVCWASRDDLEIDNFVLTNKNLYCSYEKSNGIFKKATKELSVLSLSDIKVINGKALVQQIKYEGSWCLQIQFRQGTEHFAFYDAPKKVIPQWVEAINNTLGIVAAPAPTTPRKQLSSIFGGAFAEVADSFKSMVDTATETFGVTTKQSGLTAQTPPVAHEAVQQPADDASKHSFCVECGTKLSPGTKFCPNCGYKVGANITSEITVQATTDDVSKSIVEEKPIIHSRATPVVADQPKANNTQRQQEYVGKVFKCPNCGNVINQSDAVCDSCGYHLSGKQAIGSALDFQQQLLKVEMTRQNKKIGFWDQREALDATDKQIIALIKSYPVPNSIEDIVEFFHLAIGNIDVAKSKKSVFNSDSWDGGSRERAISNAWVGKLQQIYKKAELFFPNEPEFVHIKEAYQTIAKELKL